VTGTGPHTDLHKPAEIMVPTHVRTAYDRPGEAPIPDERDRVGVWLLPLFETLCNADQRVLKDRRALTTALF
jgi:hypothetical protein